MVNHSQENQAFKCKNETCHKTFRYKRGLTTHMRRIHKDHMIKSKGFHIQEHKQLVVRHPKSVRLKEDEVLTNEFSEYEENYVVSKEEADKGELFTRP